VGVLPAVFAHPGDLTFGVAGIEREVIEGRIEKLNQAGLAPNESLVDSLHRFFRMCRIARAADNRPALRQRVDI
jgi:hypothetical protein